MFFIEGNSIHYTVKGRNKTPVMKDVQELMGYISKDNFLRGAEHKSFFTFSTLYMLLRFAGFERIYRSVFLRSESLEMRKPGRNEGPRPVSGFDIKENDAMSLYIECEK